MKNIPLIGRAVAKKKTPILNDNWPNLFVLSKICSDGLCFTIFKTLFIFDNFI